MTPTSDSQRFAVDTRLATHGIAGGAVYDALVGEAARIHDRRLPTRDRRALSTYPLLGVEFRLIEP
ncbi:MAG: hypothetical protein L0H41_07825 [Microlunatus sp.]|nr:hypothetical protein [Microlunatus sp.]MDN5769275.1 hypothetical protein [Microlunatus sp.]